MPKKVFEHTEEKIKQASHIDPKQRQEIEALISKAKDHLDDVPADKKADAETLAHFTHLAVHELLKPEQDPELLSLAEQGMQRSLEKFESSHPQFFVTLKSLINSLASLGV